MAEHYTDNPILVRLLDGRAALLVETWEEPTDIVGSVTNDQFNRQELSRSQSGKWILERSCHGVETTYEEITPAEAAGWLAAAKYEQLPSELSDVVV